MPGKPVAGLRAAGCGGFFGWYVIGIMVGNTVDRRMTDLTRMLQALDPASSQPLYLQLQRALREAIETQVLGPDDALPSERQLAAELGVSRITVRKAIDGLAAEGLLVSK